MTAVAGLGCKVDNAVALVSSTHEWLLRGGGCLVVKGCVCGCECGCVCKSVGVRVFVSVRACVCACWQQSYKLAKIVYVNFKFGI